MKKIITSVSFILLFGSTSFAGKFDLMYYGYKLTTITEDSSKVVLDLIEVLQHFPDKFNKMKDELADLGVYINPSPHGNMPAGEVYFEKAGRGGRTDIIRGDAAYTKLVASLRQIGGNVKAAAQAAGPGRL